MSPRFSVYAAAKDAGQKNKPFVCAITLAYAIKTYILFSSCYNNYCPQITRALYLMVGCAMVMLMDSGFPEFKTAVKKRFSPIDGDCCHASAMTVK
ncbi:MAG: hypothetical protein IPH68_15630 [Chitinophagaceae bacterium]|nr:hypothetical protein [Chitinophagaceae bacterium]